MKLFEKQKLSRRRHQNINKISLSTNQQFSLFIILFYYHLVYLSDTNLSIQI